MFQYIHSYIQILTTLCSLHMHSLQKANTIIASFWAIIFFTQNLLSLIVFEVTKFVILSILLIT